MNPWENPAYRYRGECYPHPVAYYRGLRLAFVSHASMIRTPTSGDRYVCLGDLANQAIHEQDGVRYMNVRFTVTTWMDCERSAMYEERCSGDDVACGETHQWHTGGSTVAVPLQLLRQLAREQNAMLPAHLRAPRRSSRRASKVHARRSR